MEYPHGGRPVYTESLGLSSAEVYAGNGVYWVFLVGDQLAYSLGSSTSLEDCKAEIESLKRLTRSDLFKSEFAKVLRTLEPEDTQFSAELSNSPPPS